MIDTPVTHETENEFSERSIPQTAKGFEAFCWKHARDWPNELSDLGQIALWVLKLMDQPNFEKSPAMIELSKAALLAFAEAYAKRTGGK